jgi:hypothetical protein
LDGEPVERGAVIGDEEPNANRRPRGGRRSKVFLVEEGQR